jgi:hypothetical protein
MYGIPENTRKAYTIIAKYIKTTIVLVSPKSLSQYSAIISPY